jgi:hypothetical protein
MRQEFYPRDHDVRFVFTWRNSDNRFCGVNDEFIHFYTMWLTVSFENHNIHFIHRRSGWDVHDILKKIWRKFLTPGFTVYTLYLKNILCWNLCLEFQYQPLRRILEYPITVSSWQNISRVYRSYHSLSDRLCGLVVSVADYKHRGPGFDSRALLRIFPRELGLERGPLSLVIG